MGAGAPVAVGNGTLLYIGAAVVVIIWFWAFSRGGYISKDAFQYVQMHICLRGECLLNISSAVSFAGSFPSSPPS